MGSVVSDVPDAGKKARLHRFDVVCAGSSSRVLALQAPSAVAGALAGCVARWRHSAIILACSRCPTLLLPWVLLRLRRVSVVTVGLARVLELVVHKGTMPVLASLGAQAGEDDELRFSHLTFQEYLVAAEIADRFKQAAPEDRALLLRKLLRQGDRSCAALAVEEPRWHVVLETCAELVGVSELAQPLLWCESRELAVGGGRDILVPFLAVDAGLLAFTTSVGRC